MAFDALDQAAGIGLLDARPCTTARIVLDVDDSIEADRHAARQRALQATPATLSRGSSALRRT